MSSLGPSTRSAKRSPRRARTARIRRTSQRSVPTPKIIDARGKVPRPRSRDRRRLDDATIGADRAGDAELERVGDEGMADGDLEDAAHRDQEGAQIGAVEVVARVDAEAEALGRSGGVAEGRKRRGLRRGTKSLRIRLGIELDAVGAD